MEIVIAAQGLAFGPNTIDHRSLGGSETAALQMARELRKLGHLVTVFCNLPPQGYPDHIPNGAQDDLGVRWVQFEQFAPFISGTEVDLLIVSRNPDLFQVNHQAKKAVLWCHDLATYKGLLPRLMQSAWNFDEIWTVSEYHKKQIHDVTGYPLKNIRATRNGITKFESILEVPREERTLLYSARPERGLENLVKPGGIMEQLPDFKLRVTMYENYPDHMMDYYRQLWYWCEKLPNVELLGPKTQMELRQLMASSWLYVYPTWFEEVSCIIARECIEQKLPVLTSNIGAMMETLGSCGYYMETKPEDATFIEDFVEAVKYLDACPAVIDGLSKLCSERTDLYWDEVAKQWEEWAEPKQASTYSTVLSLIKDSDIIAADAVLVNHQDEVAESSGLQWLQAQLHRQYPFLYGEISIEEHYKRIYEFETSKGVPERQSMKTLRGSNRYNSIAEEVHKLPDDSYILDYGCAEGPIILGLAQDFPKMNFVGVDFVEDNIHLCKKFAEENEITNVSFFVGSTKDWPGIDGYDLTIVSEVLEHTICPWEVTDFLESKTKIGGRIVLTVPQGPWEWKGLKGPQWNWRAHIWHINKEMLREMYQFKEGCIMASLTEGVERDGRACGHLAMSYTVDRKPAVAIDPLWKAKKCRPRQSIAACMIAMNDDDKILRCLNSIQNDIDQLQIAIGPCSDHTIEFVGQWAIEHPWIDFRWVVVPKIEAKEFGFDDARNASIKGVEADWILWIDSDEYLSGEGIQVFLRNNCFDSYAIHQHHFSCDPRGAPPQLDKPARLIRNDGRFKFFGKVHEHAELGPNGGPGFVMVLPNIDIGHTGYVNDFVRRSRFGRNFPLLEWDREVYPERKLGLFLWLRDYIHRMRMLDNQGAKHEARRLAEEAVEFYKEHAHSFEGVGAGSIASNNALSYYSEALQYLGRGFPVSVQIQFDEQTATYQGIFENAEDAFEIGTRAVAEEMRKRKSGYWQ